MKKGGKLKKIIIILVVIVVLGAIFGNKDGKEAQKSNTAPQGAATKNSTENGGRVSGNNNGSSGTKQPENNVQNQSDNVTSNQPAEMRDQSYISPELREFLESYEAFMDEYVVFAETYDSSNIEMLTQYANMMNKYYDFAKKAEAYDSSTMTDAEAIYYAETLNRISIKLLKASQNMQK